MRNVCKQSLFARSLCARECMCELFGNFSHFQWHTWWEIWKTRNGENEFVCRVGICILINWKTLPRHLAVVECFYHSHHIACVVCVADENMLLLGMMKLFWHCMPYAFNNIEMIKTENNWFRTHSLSLFLTYTCWDWIETHTKMVYGGNNLHIFTVDTNRVIYNYVWSMYNKSFDIVIWMNTILTQSRALQ